MKHTTVKQNKSQKVFVIAVALLFVGSMGGAMLYSSGDTQQVVAELPESKIFQGITDVQKERILFGSPENTLDRYVLITFNSPKICDMDCNHAKRILGQMVAAFEPSVYLTEVQTPSTSLDISITMESYRDKKELSAFNQTAIEDFICSNTVYRIHECVIRNMNLESLDENRTEERGNFTSPDTKNSTEKGFENKDDE